MFVFWLPAETAHRLGMLWLELVAGWLRRRPPKRPAIAPRPALAVQALGMSFAHPVGLAAGLDKGDVVPEALFRLGFAFVEIGTVTPRPQAGNPKPRLFRLPRHEALINRMGFNNPGMEVVALRLARVRHRAGPIWINIGKNKDTPNDDAENDYTAALRTLYVHGDAFVVNVSSPNTPGLRDLQSEEKLAPLLAAVVGAGKDEAARRGVAERPILLKLSPDVADEALPGIVAVAAQARVAGLIATNTTLARPVDDPRCQEPGGFSGPALMVRSTEVLTRLRALAGSRLTLVGVGGVSTADDVRRKQAAGATLVEIYTSFIYGGPGHPRRLVSGL